MGLKLDGRCGNCEYARIINASVGWSFVGCKHKPYDGKWVVEIKDCPKDTKSVTP